MAEIRTLMDGNIQIAPRTVAKAIMTDAKKSVEEELSQLTSNITDIRQKVDAVIGDLGNISTLLDAINGEVV